jgi:hypothetical protein
MCSRIYWDKNLKDDDLKHDDRRALARVTMTLRWP